MAAQAAHRGPSADNLQPLRFRFSGVRPGDRLVVSHGARSETSFPARHPATLMAVGAAVENVVQIAAAIGAVVEILAIDESCRLLLPNRAWTSDGVGN